MPHRQRFDKLVQTRELDATLCLRTTIFSLAIVLVAVMAHIVRYGDLDDASEGSRTRDGTCSSPPSRNCLIYSSAIAIEASPRGHTAGHYGHCGLKLSYCYPHLRLLSTSSSAPA